MALLLVLALPQTDAGRRGNEVYDKLETLEKFKVGPVRNCNENMVGPVSAEMGRRRVAKSRITILSLV